MIPHEDQGEIRTVTVTHNVHGAEAKLLDDMAVPR